MQLIPLLITVFIDSLGFGLVFPIFSPMLLNPEGGFFSPEISLAFRGFVIGILIASYCIGQFFGGPFLGALSDRFGRKKVLFYSMCLAAGGFLLAGLSITITSLILLFIARLMTGVSAGSFSVAQSAVSDLSTKENKVKNFGLVGMSFWTGFVIGPFIGGRLAVFGFTFPFLASSFFCMANALLITFMMKETFTPNLATPLQIFRGISQIRKAFSIPSLRGLFSVMFVFCLGWGFFTEFSPIFLIRRLHFNVEQIANFYAWVGLWIAVSQGLLIRPILKWFAPQSLLKVGLILMGLMLPIMLFINSTTGLFILIPWIALSQALIFPTSATLVSNLGTKETQGEILGINNSVQWAAIAIPPLFSGSLVALFPHLPVTVGSVCMCIAFLIFLRVRPVQVEE